jgi:O-antigen ligase
VDATARVGLIMFVIVNTLRSRSQQRFFMFFFLGAFALYPARGTLVNYFIGGYDLGGRAIWNNQFANPNDLAALTLLQLSLALAFLAREPKGWPRLAALSALFVLPLIILLTQSRGTIIGFGVAALLFVATQRRRGRTLLIAAAVGGMLVALAPASVWERLGGLRHVADTDQLAAVDPEGSAEQRFEIWKVAAVVIADHKVKGVGAGAYIPAHLDYTRSGRFAPTARGARDAHSTYITLVAETGFIGFAIFMSLLVGTLLKAERVRRRARERLPRTAQQLLCLELGLIGFFAAGVFASYAHLAMTNIFIALLWCVAHSGEEEVAALDAGAGWSPPPMRGRSPVSAVRG